MVLVELPAASKPIFACEKRIVHQVSEQGVATVDALQKAMHAGQQIPDPPMADSPPGAPRSFLPLFFSSKKEERNIDSHLLKITRTTNNTRHSA